MMVESKDTIVSRIRILEKMLKYREYYFKELAEKEDWNTYIIFCYAVVSKYYYDYYKKMLKITIEGME
jgi:hypothetical protein